jgi:16S rRNA processing protein RimM
MVKIMVQEYLEVGKIVNTHGVKGEIKVMPLTDDPQRFTKLKRVYLDKMGTLEKVDIEEVKFQKNTVILKLKGINDLNTAETLKEMFLKVDRQDAVKLPKDSFFVCDLIGCEVFEENGMSLGFLKEILKTGSNDVYAVGNENKKDILIPALKSVVKEISIENKKIIVSLPKGLIDNEV